MNEIKKTLSSDTTIKANFVGRRAETKQLLELLESVVSGTGQVAVLTGEAGIGKTRLAQEILNLSKQDGLVVLEARCFTSVQSLPYAPILNAINPLLQALDPLEKNELIHGLTDLGRLFPDLQPNDPAFPTGLTLEKTRLFESLTMFLERLSKRSGVLFFLDDLHEADLNTLEFIQYVCYRIHRQRIMVLATSRTEKDGNQNIIQLLNSLQRKGVITRLELHPFMEETTVELIHNALSKNIPEDLSRIVCQRAVGVPLFIVELLKMFIETGALTYREGFWDLNAEMLRRVPRQIASLIKEKILNLNDVDRRVLNFVSVNNSVLPFSILQSAMNVDDETLLEAIVHLRDRGILQEQILDTDVGYQTAHPLFKEVAYANLSELERRILHKSIYRALEQRHPDDILQLAHHYKCARAPVETQQVFDVFLAAGIRYLLMHAYESATEYLQSALQSVIRNPGLADSTTVKNLRISLGEAFAGARRDDQALALLDEVYGEAVFRLDMSTAIHLKRLMANVEYWSSSEKGLSHINDGLQLWDGLSANDDVMDLLYTQVETYMGLGEFTRGRESIDKIIRYAEQFPSPLSTNKAKMLSLQLSYFDWERSYEVAPQITPVLTEAKSLEDWRSIYVGFHLACMNALYTGNYRLALDTVQQGEEELRTYGILPLSYQRLRVSALILSGDWEKAIYQSYRIERQAKQVNEQLSARRALDLRAVIFALEGRFEQSQRCVSESERIYKSMAPGNAPRIIGRGLHIACAIRAFQDNSMDVTGLSSDFWGIDDGMGILALQWEAEYRAKRGETGWVKAVVEKFRAASPEGVTYFRAIADLLEGYLYQASGDSTCAASYFRNAASTFTFLDIPFETAKAKLASGMLLAKSSMVEEAARATTESLEVFTKISADPQATVANRLLRRLGKVSTLNIVRRESGLATRSILSNRELEIARLVADGLTNKEIAQTLFVSSRTVGTHLERIYKKLEVSSRAMLTKRLYEQ